MRKVAFRTDQERQQIALTSALLPCVGILFGEAGGSRWSGTCFTINRQQQVLTCAHCVDQDTDGQLEPDLKLWVSFTERDFWVAKLKAINYELDVAVLQLISPTPKPEWLDE